MNLEPVSVPAARYYRYWWIVRIDFDYPVVDMASLSIVDSRFDFARDSRLEIVLVYYFRAFPGEDMQRDGSTANRRSRRWFLAAATTGVVATTAGCVGWVLDTGEADGPTREIEPEAVSDPREGTPGEFYTLLQRNEVGVESLQQTGNDLLLRYTSDADDEQESMEELAVILTVYNENLVKNDAGIEMLYGEISNPFDKQAHGWGAKAEWFEAYNAGEKDEPTLWTHVLNSRVYEEDLEEVRDAE